MANKGATPPAGRRIYSPGIGGTSTPRLGAAVYRSPLLNYRKTPTQRQIYAQKTLAVAAAMMRQMYPWEREVSKEIAGASGYTWKDQFYAMLFGTGLEFTDINGVQYYSRRELALNIQNLLDSISSAAGAILVRTPGGWASLLPGDAGKVLTMNSTTGLPDWVEPEAAPAGSDVYAFPQFNSPSIQGASAATMGQVIVSLTAFTIKSVVAIVKPGSAGKVYKGFVGSIDTSAKLLSVLALAGGSYTSVGANYETFELLFTPNVAVTAGQKIIIGLIRTDGTGSSSVSFGQSSGPSLFPNLPIDTNAMVTNYAQVGKHYYYTSNSLTPTNVTAAGTSSNNLAVGARLLV